MTVLIEYLKVTCKAFYSARLTRTSKILAYEKLTNLNEIYHRGYKRKGSHTKLSKFSIYERSGLTKHLFETTGMRRFVVVFSFSVLPRFFFWMGLVFCSRLLTTINWFGCCVYASLPFHFMLRATKCKPYLCDVIGSIFRFSFLLLLGVY